MIADYSLRESIQKQLAELIETRHLLHQHPELGFEELFTSELVASKLKAMGLSPIQSVGKTGVVCLIEGEGEGKTLLLRADMDALPIVEQTGLEYVSASPGKMHACGHDGHTTILLGAAAMLAQRRSQFKGTVKLVFQPSEETVKGAQAMIEAGVLENPKVDAAIALHGWPGIPLGKIGLKSGAIMASSDSFDLYIEGKGGHAAYPQGCIDPVYVASLIIQAMQGLVSRESGLDQPCVVSFTRLEAGTAYNIIPEKARLSGTYRTLSEAKRAHMKRRIEEVATNIAEAYQAKAELLFHPGTPVTANDARMTALLEKTITEAFGAQAIEAVPHPSMGAEDFAYFTQKVPGIMFHLGLGDRPFCHSPLFDFDDRALPLGIEIFVRSALEYLKGER